MRTLSRAALDVFLACARKLVLECESLVCCLYCACACILHHFLALGLSGIYEALHSTPHFADWSCLVTRWEVQQHFQRHRLQATPLTNRMSSVSALTQAPIPWLLPTELQGLCTAAMHDRELTRLPCPNGCTGLPACSLEGHEESMHIT